MEAAPGPGLALHLLTGSLLHLAAPVTWHGAALCLAFRSLLATSHLPAAPPAPRPRHRPATTYTWLVLAGWGRAAHA